MSSTVTNFSNNINVLYPVPGVDNDTQGFRDNFASIKNALQSAAQELSQLELTSVKLNDVNDYGYEGSIYRGVLKATGYVTANEDTITSSTNVSFLTGNYRKFSVDGDATISFSNWPDSIYAEIILEVRNFSSTNTASIALNVLNLKKPVGLNLPIVLEPGTNDNTPLILKAWSSNGGETVFFDKILDPYTSLTPFMYDPANSLTDVATAQFANSSTTATYALNVIGSTQTNITTLGTLTNVKVGAATIKYDNSNLIISGVSGLTIETNSTISKILTDWSGGSGLLSTINTLTFTSVTGIDLGDTFKLWGSETATHIVKSINTASNQITTDPFDSTSAITSGSVGDGSSITFFKGLLYNSVYYAAGAPGAAIGAAGDKRGAIFATSSTIYVCYANYDGTSPIWAKVSTTAW